MYTLIGYFGQRPRFAVPFADVAVNGARILAGRNSSLETSCSVRGIAELGQRVSFAVAIAVLAGDGDGSLASGDGIVEPSCPLQGEKRG